MLLTLDGNAYRPRRPVTEVKPSPERAPPRAERLQVGSQQLRD